MSVLDGMVQTLVKQMDQFKKKGVSQRKQMFDQFQREHQQQLDSIGLKIREEMRHGDVTRKRVLDKYQQILAEQQAKLQQINTRLQNKDRPKRRQEEEEEEEEALLQEQDVVFDVDIVHHDSQLQQRQKRLDEVQSNMQQVNELYKEMSQIQQEQDPMFQKIEESLTVTSTRIDKAKGELVKTKSRQDQQRNNYCLYLLVLTCLLTYIMIDKF